MPSLVSEQGNGREKSGPPCFSCIFHFTGEPCVMVQGDPVDSRTRLSLGEAGPTPLLHSFSPRKPRAPPPDSKYSDGCRPIYQRAPPPGPLSSHPIPSSIVRTDVLLPSYLWRDGVLSAPVFASLQETRFEPNSPCYNSNDTHYLTGLGLLRIIEKSPTQLILIKEPWKQFSKQTETSAVSSQGASMLV